MHGKYIILCNFGGHFLSGFKVIEGAPTCPPPPRSQGEKKKKNESRLKNYSISVWTPVHTAPNSGTETYPICDDPLSTPAQRSFAPLQKWRRNKTTVLMCEQKPYPLWFSSRRTSYPIYCRYSLTLVMIRFRWFAFNSKQLSQYTYSE